MSNAPRKFSEKIALLNQKQAEHNAAYQLIMAEVKSIRRPSTNSLAAQVSFMTDEINDADEVFPDLPDNINEDDFKDIVQANLREQQQCYSKPNTLLFNVQKDTNSSHINQDNFSNNLLQENFKFVPAIPQFDKQNQSNKFAFGNTNSSQINPSSDEASFLQLPNDFRRAHSDSSLHQSATVNAVSPMHHNNNTNNNNSTMKYNYQYFETQNFTQPIENSNNNDNNINKYSITHDQLQFNFNNNAQTSLNFNKKGESGDVADISQHQHSNNAFIESQLHQPNYQTRFSLTNNNLSPNSDINNNKNHTMYTQNQLNFASLPDLTALQSNQMNIKKDILSTNNFHQQHNQIGPIKPTHSVSPTRGMARYNPTSSPTARRLSPQRLDNNISVGFFPNESLPQSPQSQHSCFNSPQGSPGPHQELNQLFSTNYESIQKQFGSMDLDAQQNYNSLPKNNNNDAFTSQNEGCMSTTKNKPTHNINHNNKNNNDVINKNTCRDYHYDEFNLTKTSNSFYNSYSEGNIQNNYQSNKSQINLNHYIELNDSSQILLKPPNNSIPDITFTSFSDSLEEKNTKTYNNDYEYDEQIKNSNSIDFDNLQMFHNSNDTE